MFSCNFVSRNCCASLQKLPLPSKILGYAPEREVILRFNYLFAHDKKAAYISKASAPLKEKNNAVDDTT